MFEECPLRGADRPQRQVGGAAGPGPRLQPLTPGKCTGLRCWRSSACGFAFIVPGPGTFSRSVVAPVAAAFATRPMRKVLIGALNGAIRWISSRPPLNQIAPSGPATIWFASELTPAKIWVISPLGAHAPDRGRVGDAGKLATLEAGEPEVAVGAEDELGRPEVRLAVAQAVAEFGRLAARRHPPDRRGAEPDLNAVPEVAALGADRGAAEVFPWAEERGGGRREFAAGADPPDA